MRNPLSDKIVTIQPSGIRKFFDIVSEMKDAISLGVGEPDFDTPWRIREEGIYSLEKGRTYYTSNSGLKELRAEISNYLNRHYGLSYEPDGEIFVTVGGSEAIDLAFRAMLNPGDEVIILVLPFPNNPTGAVMTGQELEEIARICIEKDIFVVSDEIYSELTYCGKHCSIASIDGMKERTVVINGFSKSHAMTGWRLGYACAPKLILSQMVKIHQFAIMCAPTNSQYAAVEGLRGCDDEVAKMRSEYDGRRRFMLGRLREMGLKCFEPFGAFYIFPNIAQFGLTSDEFAMRFLEEQRVAVVPGTVLLAFHRDVALDVASKMCMMTVTELDELSKSALRELGNMILGNAATVLSTKNVIIDITPPAIVQGNFKIERIYAQNICIPMTYDGDKLVEFDISITEGK